LSIMFSVLYVLFCLSSCCFFTENIIDNPETLATLGTTHRRKTNKTKNTTQKT
jgi:hypothetical protein